jgi:hypothetical protein
MTNDEHEARITALEKHAAVTDERMQYRQAERSADFLQLSKLVDTAIDLKVNQRVLETRVAIYAGLGSFFGAAVMSIVVNVLLDLIRH